MLCSLDLISLFQILYEISKKNKNLCTFKTASAAAHPKAFPLNVEEYAAFVSTSAIGFDVATAPKGIPFPIPEKI